MSEDFKERRLVPALKIKQWAADWNNCYFDKESLKAEPKSYFYMFSMKASELKKLTGVYRRSAEVDKPRLKDPNVQRGHEEKRSEVISRFVRFGYPLCEIGKIEKGRQDERTLQKPGWLPTAILVNILEPGDERNGNKIHSDDLVTILEEESRVSITLPEKFESCDWEPKQIFPFEVIDGQHRLWAFENFDPGSDFELPVVAFHGLDRSWQAYLFWSVNITPKKINRSLAYDLYPLLRREDWLDKFSGHSIYRETRSQELVEALWSHTESPWFQRINMLGELGRNKDAVGTQAAWVRSLMHTFVKERTNNPNRIGGLFGPFPKSDHALNQSWNRAMQAAYLIEIGNTIKNAVRETDAEWALSLRKIDNDGQVRLFKSENDPAFSGKYSLLATDQGIRGILHVTNDLSMICASQLGLSEWIWADVEIDTINDLELAATDKDAVSLAIKSLKKQKGIYNFLEILSKTLATYDWRASSTPNIDNETRLQQLVFRGGSGYRELRKQLLEHFVENCNDCLVKDNAKKILTVLGY